MERDKKQNLIFIGVSFIAFLLKFAFTMWDKETELHRFFDFDPQLMTKPAYVDYFADCWTYVIIYLVLLIGPPKTREYVFYITLIWIGYFIEFYYRYNNPFFKIGVIPIGMSTFFGLCFIALFTREALRR